MADEMAFAKAPGIETVRQKMLVGEKQYIPIQFFNIEKYEA